MANLNGSWLGTYWQHGNPTRFELTLVQAGNSLTGNILDDGSLGEAHVIGEIQGRRITFTKRYLNSRYTINYTGIVAETEDFMSGEWTISLFDSGKWEASKNHDQLDLNLELQRYLKVPVSV
jgi:hypothetical protein